MATDAINTTPTRRAMLASIAAFPAIGVAGQLAAATADPEWTRLVAEWQTAHDTMLEVGKRYDAAERRYSEAPKPAKPQQPEVPKILNPDGSPNDEAVRSIIRGPYSEEHKAYEQRCKEWRAETDAIYQRITGPIEAEWNAAVDRSGETAMRILRHPVKTHQQLTEKLHVLHTEYDGFGAEPDDRGTIIADVRRLLGRA